MKYLLLFLLLISPELYAKSCDKNKTCRKRFEIQSDPYDFTRESSRAHIATFATATVAINEIMKSETFTNIIGKSLTTKERLFYSAALLTLGGLVKEFAYDPDGLSRSDMANNTLGIVFGLTIELNL